MSKTKIAALGFVLGACKPIVDEPIDEEAYELCESAYDQRRSCGVKIEDDSTEMCAKNEEWDGPCRSLKKQQLECLTALSCDDYTKKTPSYYTCTGMAAQIVACEHRED